MAGGTRSRPTGITILAVLAFIAGILGILSSLAVMGLGGALGSLGVTNSGGLFFAFGLAFLAISVVELMLGYGFWTLKPWAWQLGLILAGISILLNVVGIALNYYGVSSVVLSIVIQGAIIYYLLRPEIKAAFGQK